MEQWRNRHQGKTVYVIGSGKTLDYLDPTMFDGQVTIGVNQVYKKLTPTYLVRKEKEHRKVVLRECKGATHHFWKGPGKDSKRVTHFPCSKNRMGSGRPILSRVPENGLIASWSTITTAIHLAAHMGATIIIVVGHDCASIDGKCNFRGYHTAKTIGVAWGKGKQARRRYRHWLSKIEKDTVSLKKQLKSKYGCHIVSLNPFASLRLEGHKVR